MEPKDRKKTNGLAGKHLHIKIRNKNNCEEGMTLEENTTKPPKNRNMYTNERSHNYHRMHGGFCHFQELNKISKKINRYQVDVSESDSFETLEVYESDSDSGLSHYKLFFCSDSNCVEKLDSDELIMLMNKTDLKYPGRNPYNLKTNENVKDLKSDICEKCTKREKTISVTPLKGKNRNNNGKAKNIFKKEVFECSKSKTDENDQLSEIEITKINTEYINDTERENNQNEPREITITTNIKSGESNTKYSNQYKKEIKKEMTNQKSNQDFDETIYQAQVTSNTNVSKDRKQTSNIVSKNDNKATLTASCKLDQSTSLQTLNANSNPTKVLELPGFSNLININIERGSYSVNQQPDIAKSKKSPEETNLQDMTVLENQNKDLNPVAENKTNQTVDVYPCNVQSMCKSKSRKTVALHSSSVKNTSERRSRHMSNLLTQFSPLGDDKSFSAMILAINDEIEIKEVPVMKSEICIKAVNDDNSSNKIKDNITNLSDNANIILYSETVSNRMVDDKNRKRPQSQKKHLTDKKGMSMKYVAEENPGNALNYTQGSRYTFEKRHNTSNPLITSKKSIVKPRISVPRVKRSRLKNNKKFGSSLSKIYSAHSTIVHPAILYPGEDFPAKKSNVFNPGRRISKLSKSRYDGYPRLHTLKGNSLSGIIKPQMRIIIRENYQKDSKISTNNSSNSRYKIGSISNYLSSTVESESSYSTLNWGKVADELKEDDQYMTNIP